MDDADIAVEQQRLQIEALLNSKHLDVEEVSDWNEGPKFCEECEAPIPEARRKAIPGVKYCVECATLIYG